MGNIFSIINNKKKNNELRLIKWKFSLFYFPVYFVRLVKLELGEFQEYKWSNIS